MDLSKLRAARLAAAWLLAGLLGGCATEGTGREAELAAVPPAGSATGGNACCVVVPASAEQWAIGRTAAAFIGARRIEVGGRRFPFDCSGLARGVYLAHGVDLYDGAETNETATGVRLIHRYVTRRGRLYRGPDPRPGDLVFFHNTWDRNGDGHVNDMLTHVGIVERVEADGTVVFVSRVSRGVERYRMNLAAPHLHRAPDGRIFNDYMRRKRSHDPDPTRYLTGELFAGFGTLAE